MAVKFLTQTQVGTLYNEGEIASFDEKTEEELVKAKVAEPVKGKASDKAAADKAAAEKAAAEKAAAEKAAAEKAAAAKAAGANA